MSDPYLAEIRILPYTFAPRSWALCNGQLVPLAQYMALFAVIGMTYGGDGRTTVGLPNLNDRAPMHTGGSFGTGPGLSHHYLGDRGGYDSVPLQQTEMPAHTHGLRAAENTADQSDPTNRFLAKQTGVYAQGTQPAALTMATEALASTGKSTPHSNMQPSLAMNFCICLDGIWPSRS